MNKTINPTKKKTTAPKSRKRWNGEYFDQKLKAYRPYTEEELVDLLRDLGDNEDSYHMEDFYDQLHMSPDTYHSLLRRIPGMKDAHDYAKRRIGVRRDRGALFRKMDAGHVQKTLSHYWTVYKEMEESRSDLRKSENDKKIVGLLDIAGVVPPLKVND